MMLISEEKYTEWKQGFAPFRGITIFVAVVVIAHLLWKMFIVTGVENQEYNINLKQGHDIGVFAKLKNELWCALGVGEVNRNVIDGQYIALLNTDLRSIFIPWAEKTAVINLFVVNKLCGQSVCLVDDLKCSIDDKCTTVLAYDIKKGPAINIVWGCTGVKQIYVFFLVMLFCKGNWRRRFVYFLLGVALLLLFNIIRISCVLIMLRYYPTSFEFLHDGLFKYLFYGIMFLLWMLWEERYSITKNEE